MPDIYHSDYCDGDDEDGDCPKCQARFEQMAREFGPPPPRYTREEIMDCYSDPTEYYKRERMLRWFDEGLI